MITKSRLITLAVLVAIMAALSAVAIFSPYRLSITLEQSSAPVSAADLHDVPVTATPAPPIATPVPPTATATSLPTATPVPPTATNLPTATSESPTATSLPPTATPVPSDPVRTTYGDPTIVPITTAVPTAISTAVPGVPNVKVEKKANVASAQPGQSVVFSITAHNTGSETARDVVVMDVVPDAFKIIDLSSSKGDIVADGQTVTAYPSVLAPGERVTVQISTTVREDAEKAPQRNTVFITTSTPGDTPEDNTSTVTVQITSAPAPPTLPVRKTAAPPPSLPNTADPDVPTMLMIWGPWLMFAMILMFLGFMIRYGMLRTRFVTVSLAPAALSGTRSTLPAVPEPASNTTLRVHGFDLDADGLIQAWRGGMSVATLTQQVMQQNPQADRIVVGLAVQKIIDDVLSR